MYKKSFSINLTRTTKNYLSQRADNLDLTPNTYIESLIMTKAFENGYVPDTLELENLRKSFLVTSKSNITNVFRDQILTFDEPAQASIINFFYSLNLIEGFFIKTNKMSNLFKNAEICYFALGKMGSSQQLVANYLTSFPRLNISTIGMPNANANEYLLFSNYQQFKINKPYPLFSLLLSNLNLPSNTNVIKVHYTQLSLISKAIEHI